MKVHICSVVFLQVILLSIIDSGVCDLTCLVCDSVALPRLCRSIVRCGPHEVCGLEQVVTPIGSIRYSQKCLDKRVCYNNKRDVEMLGAVSTSKRSVNNIICIACCDTDLCNSGGCNNKGFADDATLGNLCYNCDTQIGSNTCNAIEACSRDKVCQITPKHMVGGPPNLFETKCQHKADCFEAPIVGRKRAACSTCCNGTLCNDYDPTGHSCAAASTQPPITTKAAGSSPASSATAATTVAVVTPAPTVATTTRAPTTTASHHVTQGGDCKDTNGCFSYQCKSTDPNTQKYVHDYCKFTCGLCVTNPTDGPDLACKDTDGCTHEQCRDHPIWARTNCPLTCGTCTVHASAKEGFGWYLNMKATAGIPHPYASIYQLWQEPISRNTGKSAAYKDYTDTFQGPFKPEFALHWDVWRYDMVNVSMYTNGTERVFITFNATGLDSVSWFRADRVIASSWGLVPGTGDFKMSLTDATGFEFNAGTAGSSSDGCASSGWLTVVTNGNCVPDSRLTAPAFLYCPPGQQACTWRDKTYQMAEVFAIHAHSTVH